MNLKFTTLSPLHISNGEDLAYNIDYVNKGSKIRKLNTNILAKIFSDNKVFDFNKNYVHKEVESVVRRNSGLLTDDCFTYSVDGNESFFRHLENNRAEGKKYYKEFINSNGKFYIPATSIKGAMLTAYGKSLLGIDPNNAKIADKFVIRDSESIPESNFMIYRLRRPPEINLLCLKPKSNFTIKINAKGTFDKKDFLLKLKLYNQKQIELALKNINAFIEEHPKESVNAINYVAALSPLKEMVQETNLINIGFGGGSWFKVEKDKTPPPTYNKREHREETPHTSYIIDDDLPIKHIGWCKLEIEE